jgi:CheY-like chemotaxis protein
VTDNGTGISFALLPKIFDLFVQSERTLDRSQGGLGVGLSVVRRLIEMHGGRVFAQSEGPGQGSMFAIHLPLTQPPTSKEENLWRPPIRPRRILVVDDNTDAADTLSMMLECDGHTTATAFTAEDALEKTDSFRPEVVLLDIGLPTMDGYEVARRIRLLANEPPIRLVALTGYGQPEDRAQSLRKGFDGHLVKPVALEDLRMALNTASNSGS